MEIEITVTQRELDNYFDGEVNDLKQRVVDDLDEARDYPGFNVTVNLIATPNPLNLSR
ncbi:hypothetical protein AB8884_22295 [Yersinia enterocolitica]|uniref:hypothetical protein n=1 Tax=Yersinia enterocolitica TaxID=630 RepID=UPI0005DD0DBD|nr:Uncharacterised protein [Yersinia frederiksenii]HDL7917552.1 hypothetical protein [Yersinia enterocolitica]HDV5954585.1 hypothetical protein [Yersinia enterocolitica]HDV7154060.1 hypothetical protein [Yersinia enterocolitica]HED5569215.1 hypothetical protein [Yersinia enterocolitica]